MATRDRRRVGVALLLDGPAASEVQGLRRALGDRTMGRIAPHLTLVSPLNLRPADLPRALAVLRRGAGGAGPPELSIGPVATFAPSNPVLYLAVGGDLEALGVLRNALNVAPLHRPGQWPWVPHVTVAEGAERIPEALSALGAFELAVAVERVVLLELQEGDGAPGRCRPRPPGPGGARGGVALELTTSRLIDPQALKLLGEPALRGEPALSGEPALLGEPALSGERAPTFDTDLTPCAGVGSARNVGTGPNGGRPPIVITARRGAAVSGLGGVDGRQRRPCRSVRGPRRAGPGNRASPGRRADSAITRACRLGQSDIGGSGPGRVLHRSEPQFPRLFEGHRRVGGQLAQLMVGVHPADGARFGPHDQRFGGGAAVVVMHPTQQLTVGDPRCREEAVVPLYQSRPAALGRGRSPPPRPLGAHRRCGATAVRPILRPCS